MNTRTLEGLLNTDDAPEAVAPNEYIGATNIRFGGHLYGKSNRGEIIESNRLIEHNLLPAGTNLKHGHLKDTVRNRIIQFVWNSNDDHCILVFDQATETVLMAIEDGDITGGLQFNKDRYICNIDLVGDMLHWVDWPNEPKRINIEAALKAKNPSYSTDVEPYVYPLLYTNTTLIRRPPNRALQTEKIEDTAVQVNQIKNHGFRFAYRYTFRDGEQSTFSVHSALVPPNWPGEDFNVVQVTVPLEEKIEQDVLAVELAVIYADDQTMFVIQRWDKRNSDDATAIEAHNDGTTALFFNFSNNSIGSAVATSVRVKPFDSVPLRSFTQAVARNRVILGRNVLGYDTPKTTSLAIEQVEVPDTNFETVMDYTPDGFSYDDTEGLSEKIIECAVRNGPWADFTYNASTDTFTYTGAGITSGKVQLSLVATWNKNTTDPFTLELWKNTVLYKSFTWAGNIQITDITQTVVGIMNDVSFSTSDTFKFFIRGITGFWALSFSSGSSSISVLANTGTAQNGLQVNKSDAAVKGAKVFYDRFMRQSGVVTSDGVIYTSPDRTYNGAGDFNYLLQWSVSNTNALAEIPDWAHWYAPCFSKNLRTDFFFQFRGSDISYCTKATDGSYTGLGSTNTFAQTHAGIAVKADLLFGYGLGYTYNDGDIMKIYIGTSVFDVPVKAVQGDWIIGELVDASDLTSAVALVEIFTPKTNSADSFYEVGQIYPVLNPGTNTRAYSVTVGNVPPDCFLVSRKDAAGNNYYVEAMNPNDKKWRIWYTSHGRVQVVDTVGQQYISTGLAWSNRYLPGTASNGLSSFEALNTYILPLEQGPLQRIGLTSKAQQEGTVLLAIHEDDSSSIYLEETQIFDATGNASIIKTDNFIGQVNPLQGSQGTLHPESATFYEGLAFWFNISKGTVVQYSNAGIDIISRYKSSRFWRQYSDALLKVPATWWDDTEQRPLIIGGIDEWNKEVLFSLPYVLSAGDLEISPWEALDARAKTMVYGILENKWKGDYSFQPEGYCTLNNVFYTWKDGNIYVHDVKDNLCMFYGVAHDAVLKVVESMGEYGAVKTWKKMAITSNAAPDYVYAETMLPYQQTTDLYGQEFKDYEGRNYADFLRNKNTPGMTVENALLRGEMMRGYALFVELRFTGNSKEDERIFINALHFGVTLSKGQSI